ncbi:MAG TPA: hypothetical protein VG368_01545, partial [Acidimicrobiales bacterium]|nr:hypothetical protein [Acidimicrobiales bacterium]
MRDNAVVRYGARATLVLSLVISALALGAGVASAVTAPGAATGAVSAITPTTAVVNGAVTTNGATTTWYFEYGTTTSYGAKSPARTTKVSASVAATISRLTPATSYHYRIVASNSAGTTLGDDGLFSTNAVPNVVTQPTSNLTATTATMNGIVNAEGQTTSTYFEYGTTTKVPSKTPAKSVPAGAGNVAVTAPITGLHP